MGPYLRLLIMNNSVQYVFVEKIWVSSIMMVTNFRRTTPKGHEPCKNKARLYSRYKNRVWLDQTSKDQRYFVGVKRYPINNSISFRNWDFVFISLMGKICRTSSVHLLPAGIAVTCLFVISKLVEQNTLSCMGPWWQIPVVSQLYRTSVLVSLPCGSNLACNLYLWCMCCTPNMCPAPKIYNSIGLHTIKM